MRASSRILSQAAQIFVVRGVCFLRKLKNCAGYICDCFYLEPDLPVGYK
jgi:hypothetical protein